MIKLLFFIPSIYIYMNIAGYQSEPLIFRQIRELLHYDKASRVKARFAGVILKVETNGIDKLISFQFSDGTGTAEATLIYKKIPADINLPKKGDSVQMVGMGYKKVLGGSKNSYSFPKIQVISIGVITPEEEFEFGIKAAQNRKKFEKKIKQQKKTAKTKKIQMLAPQIQSRALDSPQQRVELRNLIMMYGLYIFSSNPDILSHIVQAEHFRRSSEGQQFFLEHRITKQNFEEALQRTLVEISQAGLISRKPVQQGKEACFVMKKDLFIAIEKFFEERIYETQEKGTEISQLTSYVNRKILQTVHANNFTLFDWKFSQKILIKLQSQSKIYKTSDKLIFPVIRH